MEEYSIMAKLDPRSIYPYICETERGDPEATIFFLKSLDVLQYRKCEELSFGSKPKLGEFGLKVLEYGLAGWDRFTWDDDKPIPFDISNFSAIPYLNQLELYNEIVELSEVNDELEEDIKFVTKWTDYLYKSKNPDQWECMSCMDKKQYEARNCDNSKPNTCLKCKTESFDAVCPKCNTKTKPYFKLLFSKDVNDFVTRCPVALLNNQAVKLVNIINYIDNSKSLPVSGGALEQTYFFYTIRMLVLSEQNALMKRELDTKTGSSADGKHNKKRN